MKKDKEWLEEEIKAMSHTITSNRLDEFIQVDRREVLNLIDQLNEPEMTEEQAWNKIGEAYADSEKGRLMNAKKIFDNGLEMQGVINTVIFELKKSNDDRTFEEFVIDSIKKTELPVIPQDVADVIEEAKENDWTMRQVFCQIIKFGLVNLDADSWIENNPETFVRAWLDDNYTIEKPKLLTVIVKDYDKTIMTKKMPEDEVNKMMEGLEK